MAAHALFLLLLVAGQDSGGAEKEQDADKESAGIRSTEAWKKMSSMERMAETGCFEESEDDVREKEKQNDVCEAQLARAEAALEKVFGYSKLRGQQANVILALLNGQDAFGVMPTGAGKSICYQVRCHQLPGNQRGYQHDDQRERHVCPFHTPLRPHMSIMHAPKVNGTFPPQLKQAVCDRAAPRDPV